MEYFDSSRKNGGASIPLQGEWTVGNAAEIEEALAARPQDRKTGVDTRGIKKIDTAGAWLLHKHFAKPQLKHLSARQQALMDLIPEDESQAPKQEKPSPVAAFFIHIGQAVYASRDFLFALFSFIGLSFIRTLKNLSSPAHFRVTSIVRHIYETGVQALPIVSMLAFGISMVISYQGAVQLRKFGADIYTIDLTVISLLREMAVLTTAIMVAGRSGSAFAAEIGVMKLKNEVDALKTMGIDPIEILVIPRFVALLITLPALSFIAVVVGLAGCGAMAVFQLDVTPGQYLDRIQGVATPTMFFIGMIKAPIFALAIAAVCIYQGMSAKGSAENVGKLTTAAVVQSISLVIMLDALFSIIFSEVGI